MKRGHALELVFRGGNVIAVGAGKSFSILLEAGDAGLRIGALDVNDGEIVCAAYVGEYLQRGRITVTDNTIIWALPHHIFHFPKKSGVFCLFVAAEGLVEFPSAIFVGCLSGSRLIKDPLNQLPQACGSVSA
jgi:hypothetical protein